MPSCKSCARQNFLFEKGQMAQHEERHENIASSVNFHHELRLPFSNETLILLIFFAERNFLQEAWFCVWQKTQIVAMQKATFCSYTILNFHAVIDNWECQPRNNEREFIWDAPLADRTWKTMQEFVLCDVTFGFVNNIRVIRIIWVVWKRQFWISCVLDFVERLQNAWQVCVVEQNREECEQQYISQAP